MPFSDPAGTAPVVPEGAHEIQRVVPVFMINNRFRGIGEFPAGFRELETEPYIFATSLSNINFKSAHFQKSISVIATVRTDKIQQGWRWLQYPVKGVVS